VAGHEPGTAGGFPNLFTEVLMDSGRILILGQTKENSYEIRNLLDNRKFELEIALNKEVGKTVLSTRMMDLLIVHTEAIDEDTTEFFDYLNDRGISIPVMVVGEEAKSLADRIDMEHEEAVRCFEKPYAVEELISYIEDL
jgi:DNA-binding response OmpR family regulator